MIVFRNTRRHLAVLFFLALASCVLLGGCGGGGGETKGEGDPDLLISILEGSGMMVAEGMPVQLDVQDLFCRGLLPSGYANNASTPYITFQLGETPGIAPTEFTWLYRLRQDEAVLLVGRTPPKSAYFSLQTFSALRWLEDKGYTGRIFALFGDAINHMTIRSQGSNAPFDSCFALISTGNKTTADRVRRALLEAGYGEGTVNVETIPDELVRFGHDERSDQLNFLYRIALVEDAEEEQRYYETLGGLRVFRLTPDEPQAPAPFPVSILRPKGSGSTELSLLPSLNSLEEALIDTYSGYEPEKLPTAPWFLEGYEPIIQNIDALAATNDTTYLKTPPFSLGEGDFVIAYGVQHPSTGKAVYNSVVAYGWTLLEDLPDEPRFEGGSVELWGRGDRFPREIHRKRAAISRTIRGRTCSTR